MNLSSSINVETSSDKDNLEKPTTSNKIYSKPTSIVSNHWGSSFSTIPSTPFQEVMSEQLAVQLQLSDELEFNNQSSFQEKTGITDYFVNFIAFMYFHLSGILNSSFT